MPIAASAERVTSAVAVRSNQKAFDAALAKRKLKAISLVERSADEGQATSATAVVLELRTNDRPEEPLFVVDGSQNVYRVVRAPRLRGSVAMTVCIAGPNRDYREQFAIPQGHAYKGEVKIAYDAYRILPQNTCR